MNRRLLIKNLALFSGGLLLLPSCLKKEEQKEVSEACNALAVTREQQALLAEVSETIIPATDTAGAKALGLHCFVLTMVSDCYEKDVQEKFKEGMLQFNEMANGEFGGDFVACNAEQRNQLLTALEAKQAAPDVLTFYNITKKEVVKGFLNSKLVMTELRKYELVPARYDGYFPVKSA